MKRWMFGLSLMILAAGFASNQAEAGKRTGPRRYTRGSYAEYIAQPTKNGKMQIRQVYDGYPARFPSPMFLYEGYPHSGSYGQSQAVAGSGF